MILKLVLESDDLVQRLLQAAQREGVSAEDYTARLLDQNLPPAEQGGELGMLLQSWLDEDDAAEQRETGEYLIQALEEDRLSNRKLFPPELKGETW